MSGVIYIITTGDDFYIGSTCDYKTRMYHHKGNIYNKNNKHYNYKLYKKIRENNCQYEINIYEDNLSLNKKELCIYEQEVIDLLRPTLNDIRAYCDEAQIRQNLRDRNNKFSSVRIRCECGSVITRGNKACHKRTAKHIKRMISQEQNETVKHLQMSDAE